MDQLCLDPSLLLQYERSVVAVKGLEKPQQLVSYHVYNVNKYIHMNIEQVYCSRRLD